MGGIVVVEGVPNLSSAFWFLNWNIFKYTNVTSLKVLIYWLYQYNIIRPLFLNKSFGIFHWSKIQCSRTNINVIAYTSQPTQMRLNVEKKTQTQQHNFGRQNHNIWNNKLYHTKCAQPLFFTRSIKKLIANNKNRFGWCKLE